MPPRKTRATAAKPAVYRRANTDWFAACRFGVTFHWTAKSAPFKGKSQPFAQAVEEFPLDRFVSQVAECGADYVIFTSVHALQMLPAPCAALDALLPGRTCARDLLGEMADALRRAGKHLIVYYNHGCNGLDDAEWQQAVGYHSPDHEAFAANLRSVVAELGERYGERLPAWWFDSGYSLDFRGPHNTVQAALEDWRFPWEEYTRAAKSGHPERLVTYNAGVNQTFLYTGHQDYWTGELVDLKHPPAARYLPSGLQWHGWTCLDDRAWVYSQAGRPFAEPLYPDAELFAFVRRCREHQGPMSFNVMISREGEISPPALAQLGRLDRELKRG